MRTLLLALATLLLLGSPVLAQGAAQQLESDPAVRESQLPAPSPQGTRAPEAEATDTDTGNLPLRELLTRIWASPTDLQGNPIAGRTPLVTGPTEPPTPEGTCPPGGGAAEGSACPPAGTEAPR